jgi:DNA-binding sugar fermentation-stimulating protein
VERDSIDGVATRYRLDGPGIKSQCKVRFSAHVQTCPGAHPVSYIMDTGSLLGLERPRRRVGHSPPSSTEVKERIELYLYSPSGLSWPVLG